MLTGTLNKEPTNQIGQIKISIPLVKLNAGIFPIWDILVLSYFYIVSDALVLLCGVYFFRYIHRIPEESGIFFPYISHSFWINFVKLSVSEVVN